MLFDTDAVGGFGSTEVGVAFEMALSRASPLPHSTGFHLWNAVECGSGLAREGVHQSTTVRLAFKNTRRSM